MKAKELTQLLEEQIDSWYKGIVKTISISSQIPGGRNLIVETEDAFRHLLYDNFIDNESKKIARSVKVGDKVLIHKISRPYEQSYYDQIRLTKPNFESPKTTKPKVDIE